MTPSQHLILLCICLYQLVLYIHIFSAVRALSFEFEEELPFVFLVRQLQEVVVNYFSIVLLEMSLSHCHFWRTALSGILLLFGSLGCLVWFGLVFLEIWIHYPTFSALKVSAEFFISPLNPLALRFLCVCVCVLWFLFFCWTTYFVHVLFLYFYLVVYLVVHWIF